MLYFCQIYNSGLIVQMNRVSAFLFIRFISTKGTYKNYTKGVVFFRKYSFPVVSGCQESA